MYKTQADEVRDWLRAYLKDEEEIDELFEKLHTIRATATSVGAQKITDMPRVPSSDKDTLIEYVIRTDELERQIEERIRTHQLSKQAIENVVELMESPKQQKIIRYRYIEGMEWREVIYNCYRDKKDFAVKIKAYSKRVYRDHEKALLEMARKWGKKETDQH